MHDTMKSCLFGGTLFAAGVAGQADAQITFESNFGGAYPTSLTTGYATDGSTYLGVPYFVLNQYVSYSPASSPVPDAYVLGYGFAAGGHVDAGYMYAFAYGTTGVPGYQPLGLGQAYAYFSVATPVDVTISWDFSNEFGSAYGSYAFFADISLNDWTNGGVSVFSVDPSAAPDPLSGSVTISLSTGINYSLFLEAGAAAGDGGGWATATFVKVPAPASAGMLGLAGLVATRRRR